MKYFELIFFLIVAGLIVFFKWWAETGKVPEIRRLAAIEALDEGVGRALEMGKTVVVGAGSMGFERDQGVMTLAGLDVLGHVATLCGKHGVELKYFESQPYMVPLIEDIVKTGYTAGGRPEMYNRDMVTYVGRGQAQMYVDYIWEKRPATNIQIGPLWGNVQRVLGAGAMAGCLQIGGEVRWVWQPLLIALCDYSLIGEELFAASAAIRKSPDQLGVTRGQDLVKAISLALLVFGLITAVAGSAILSKLIVL